MVPSNTVGSLGTEEAATDWTFPMQECDVRIVSMLHMLLLVLGSWLENFGMVVIDVAVVIVVAVVAIVVAFAVVVDVANVTVTAVAALVLYPYSDLILSQAWSLCHWIVE